MKIHKALYGLLHSALLFYRKLVGDLEAEGLTINPYEPCVANKIVNGKQMTIVWNVDDLKISHVNRFEVTNMLCILDSLYPGLKVKRGRIHTYLGMEMDFTEKGKVSIAMHNYMDNILMEFPEHICATATSPTADQLFQVLPDDEAQKLPEPQATAFHYTIAQLLFLSSRRRQDCQTAVAFLTIRVMAPDEDDWGKLKQVLKYLKSTRRLVLTLKADDLTSLNDECMHLFRNKMTAGATRAP